LPIIGSSPNKTFQRTDGTRTGSEVWQEAKAADVKIRADAHDTHDEDIGDAISACLFKDGSNLNADIPMSTNKFTGVGNATARTHFAAAGQIADSSLTYAGTSSGTDTITVTLTPAITAYVAGQRFHFKAGGTNTGAATFEANSAGAKDIKKGAAGSTALAGGDITSGGMYTVEYDGTNMVLLNPASINSPVAATVTTSLTVAGTASGAGKVILGEDTDNGAHTVTVQAAASMAASLTFTLPSADGTAGQALHTNGSGALAFANITPIGAIVAWPASSVPTGWLECSGAAVSRSTYATLFGVISDDFGAGDGSTTFNLPDLRGEFIRGWDHGKGSDPNAATRTDRGDGTTGDVIGSKQADEFELHGHPFRLNLIDGSTNNSSGGLSLEESGSVSNEAAFTGTLSDTPGEQIGGSGGSETRPRNVNMMYIIRAL
jgi:microcystin-dependent protein